MTREEIRHGRKSDESGYLRVKEAKKRKRKVKSCRFTEDATWGSYLFKVRTLRKKKRQRLHRR